MNWTSWVGFRYLRSKKNSRFLSFITLLSIGGVALGVLSMIVVLSVMDGFEAELRKRLMTSDVHILIEPQSTHPSFDQGFVSHSSFESHPIGQALMRDPRVERILPVLSAEGILRAGRKVSGIVVKGLDDRDLQEWKKNLKEALEPPVVTDAQDGGRRPPEVYLGRELALEMGIAVGDTVQLISPVQMEGPMASVPRTKVFLVGGLYASGIPEQELHIAFAPRLGVEAFLRRAVSVSQWEVRVKRFEDAPKLAGEVERLSTTLRVRDWMRLNAHLFASLKLERIAMFVILAFIVVVASFNIVTTLTLMVLEKKREIAMLSAMGATAREISRIFFAEGVFIGLVGVVGGVLGGVAVCLALRRYEFITLPDIYYDRTLPVTFSPLYYIGVASAALVIVLLACIYPSRRAAGISPLEGLRSGG